MIISNMDNILIIILFLVIVLYFYNKNTKSSFIPPKQQLCTLDNRQFPVGNLPAIPYLE